MNKTVLLAALMFLSAVAAAQEKAPAPLTDSKIERKLENGTVQKFDGNEYMIVKRHKPAAAKPAPKPEVKVVETVRTVETTKLVQPKKNAILLIGGYGPVGLERNSGNGSVSLERDAVGGLGLQHNLNRDWLLQLQGLSNRSVLGVVGFSF